MRFWSLNLLNSWVMITDLISSFVKCILLWPFLQKLQWFGKKTRLWWPQKEDATASQEAESVWRLFCPASTPSQGGGSVSTVNVRVNRFSPSHPLVTQAAHTHTNSAIYPYLYLLSDLIYSPSSSSRFCWWKISYQSTLCSLTCSKYWLKCCATSISSLQNSWWIEQIFLITIMTSQAALRVKTPSQHFSCNNILISDSCSNLYSIQHETLTFGKFFSSFFSLATLLIYLHH